MRLDASLPESLVVGRGTALFVAGTCFAPSDAITSLELLVDGAEQPLMAHGMPRLDVLEASGEPAAHRAGFWGMARIGPRSPGTLVIGLRARLPDGGARSAELARIAVVEPAQPLPGAPLVAIAMATFEPPAELFRRQVESIRAQTLGDWVCVISDDCSDPARFAELARVVAGDPRFVVSRSDQRRGFYGNFGRALELVPASARYVAFADQDDVWDADKLETLVAEIGDAELVYSDQRIISAAGERLADTYWSARANNHEDMLSLLVANCVTGAASLFRRDLLDVALPLPPAQFTHYHDHWIALTALALGDIRFVDRPLYDYVQHDGATLGHATATRMVRLRDRLSSLRRGLRERVRLWRTHYFLDACRALHFATVLELRCGDRMSTGKRRALARFMRADRSARPIPGLFARGARELVRRRPETLAAEWMLGYAFTWRRLLAASAPRLDALPPVFHPRPRVRVPGDPDLRVLAEGLLPLRLAPADDAPRRVNVLVESVDPWRAGDAEARLHLARRLAERGQRVRFVTVDPVAALPRGWARELERFEVAFGAETPGLEVSSEDAFVATSWRTAHLAPGRFLYLIEDYEPLRHPSGTLAALASESYTLPHFALFSSEPLREYFRRRGIGVHDDDASATFEEAVTLAPPGRTTFTRRLLFDAGELFELGVLGLSRALERGAFADWALECVGSGRSGRLDLGGGDWMRLPPEPSAPGYDVGLAPIAGPRPGRVPLEMARAGTLAVTTTYECKDARALRAISPNLIAAEPTIEGIAGALVRASEAAADVEARLRGSALRWSLEWGESFGDELLDRVTGFLRS